MSTAHAFFCCYRLWAVRAKRIQMAKTKTLIILRPNQYNKGDLRLALFTEDFHQWVQHKDIRALYVNLGASDRRIDSLATYLHHGSIVKKSIVSEWLHRSNCSEEADLMLFELTVDERLHQHTYRYLGLCRDIQAQIAEFESKIR